MSHKKELSYDQIKKMLGTIRNYDSGSQTRRRSLNEQKTDSIVIGDNIEVKIHSDDDDDLPLTTEEKNSLNQLVENFKSQVYNLVDFSVGFNIYKNSVRLDGAINNDMTFVYMSGEDRGLYVNCNMLEVTPENADIFNKLHKFLKTYEDTTNNLILTRRTN